MYILGLKSGTIGDSAWLTPAIHSLRQKNEEVIVQMYNNEQCRAVSVIFDNLAKVEFVENPLEPLYHINKDKTHYAQRILNVLGDNVNNCIPKVVLTTEEIEWAQNYLKGYANPIIIINDVSGKNDPTNYRAKYVSPPDVVMQAFCDDFIQDGYTVLQFGQPDKFTPLKNAIHITNLTIRQTLACFSIIKRGIFPDSGLYHAMLSVGGKAVVLHPPESVQLGYIFHELHYLPELWKEEPIRVDYIDYTTIKL